MIFLLFVPPGMTPPRDFSVMRQPEFAISSSTPRSAVKRRILALSIPLVKRNSRGERTHLPWPPGLR
jgi:hypothetical protein